MDRHQLCAALRAAEVPAGRYEIAGCPGGPWPADRLFLAEQGGQWVVGVQERGRREVMERFPDEDSACRYLYGLLTDEGPQAVPLTPEEAGRLLHDSEGIQRRAREQLTRALKAARRPPTDGAPQSSERPPSSWRPDPWACTNANRARASPGHRLRSRPAGQTEGPAIGLTGRDVAGSHR